MTTYVLMVWLSVPWFDSAPAPAPARVDEYRTLEACEAAGQFWEAYFNPPAPMNPHPRFWGYLPVWACLPGER